MRLRSLFCTIFVGLILTSALLQAQPPAQAAPQRPGQAAEAKQRPGQAAEQTPREGRGAVGRGPAAGRPFAGASGGLPQTPVLMALDADRDGELSPAEISNAAQALRGLDTDNSGSLTRNELLGGPGGEGGGVAGAAAGAETMVQQLVQRTLTMDQNGDGRLSKAEIPAQMQGVLARADANQDGALDRLELIQMAQQRVAMMARGGRAAAGGQGGAAGFGAGGEAGAGQQPGPGEQAAPGGPAARGEGQRGGRAPRPGGDGR